MALFVKARNWFFIKHNSLEIVLTWCVRNGAEGLSGSVSLRRRAVAPYELFATPRLTASRSSRRSSCTRSSSRHGRQSKSRARGQLQVSAGRPVPSSNEWQLEWPPTHCSWPCAMRQGGWPQRRPFGLHSPSEPPLRARSTHPGPCQASNLRALPHYSVHLRGPRFGHG